MIFKRIIELYRRRKFMRMDAHQMAEAMRDKFYYLGKNVNLYTRNFGTEPYLISIHDNVTCASNVSFVNHDVSCFNVARFLGLPERSLDKVGPITLYENCFIGADTMLMMGCSVGKNSIVAARSVVTKNIPENEVWGGAPARFIMTLNEYAERVKNTALAYPWVDSATACKKKNITEAELIRMRQEYFFEDSHQKDR